MGRPLLAYLIERLPRATQEVFLAVSFMPEAITRWVEESGDPVLQGRTVHVVKEDPPLGTGGALGHLVDTAGLGRGNGPVLVVNGDLVTDMDLEGLVEVHTARRATATIMLVQVEDPSRFGMVGLDGDWRIRRFVEKPAPGQAPSDWANAGAYVLQPEVIGRVPRGEASSLERVVFPRVAEEDAMYGHPHEGLWIDCGTLESYLHAHRVLLERGEGVMQGDDSGNVCGRGVRVAQKARVARSLLQDGVVVEAGAVVEDSVIGAGAVIGKGAHVQRSIVQEGVRVAAGVRIHGARVIAQAE